jgi:hypothetical protein
MQSYRQTLVRFIGALALIALPLPALAQGVGIGAKIGPLFSSLSEAGVSDTGFENRTGWIGGLFIGGNRAGRVGVGVDILYARKGATESETQGSINLDYLNVPIYARVNIGSPSRGGASVYGIGGLDLNFLIRSKLSNGDDIKENFKSADYGLALGLGVEITRFLIEGRYTKGLGNIAKDNVEFDTDVKTQSFALMFGVRFN